MSGHFVLRHIDLNQTLYILKMRKVQTERQCESALNLDSLKWPAGGVGGHFTGFKQESDCM